MQDGANASRTRRRQTCGSFDVPDLPKIMSSLALDTGSPVLSDRGTPSPRVIEPEDSPEVETPTKATGSGRNRLSRASKSDCLLRMNRRVSMKPQRKVMTAKLGSSSEEDIKRFYLNNKLGSAASRQNALETIFEEPAVVRNELRMVGLKKLKRTIAFKDGVTINKTTVQSRRKKIKSLFGATKKFNKLSMDAFLQHLQSLSEEEEEVDGKDGERNETGDQERQRYVVPNISTAAVATEAP